MLPASVNKKNLKRKSPTGPSRARQAHRHRAPRRRRRVLLRLGLPTPRAPPLHAMCSAAACSAPAPAGSLHRTPCAVPASRRREERRCCQIRERREEGPTRRGSSRERGRHGEARGRARDHADVRAQPSPSPPNLASVPLDPPRWPPAAAVARACLPPPSLAQGRRCTRARGRVGPLPTAPHARRQGRVAGTLTGSGRDWERCGGTCGYGRGRVGF